MNKKASAKKTWLPLIFVTVLNSGAVMAEPDAIPLNLPKVQEQAPQAQVPPATQTGAVPAATGMENRFTPIIDDLAKRFPTYSHERILIVDTTAQKMFLIENGKATNEWVISSAEKGVGSEKGSDQTPLGVHRIAEKIGAGAQLGTIFKSRQNTGEIVNILTAPGADSPDDYVTSRILWLDGLEPGLNKGGNVDSHERFIYIHGTGEEGRLGTPASHGCIRMKNKDVIDLFERVNENTLVVITRQRQE